MKLVTFACGMLVLLMASSLAAGMKVPSSVFTMEEIDKAKAKAAKDSEPLIFVFTDPETTCPLCVVASQAAFKEMRRAGVVVFADTKKDKSALPPGVKDVRSQAGNTIPMVFVTTADGQKGLKGIKYDALKEDAKEVARTLRDELKSVDVVGEGAPKAEPTAVGKSSLFAESQQWTNQDNVVITAAILKVEQGKVHFLMPNGQSMPYPLEKLSEASQAKIKAIQEGQPPA